MFILLIVRSLAMPNFNFPFNCSNYVCPSYLQFDSSQCTVGCMTPPCNYNSADQTSADWIKRFFESGCAKICGNLGCDPRSLGNNVCDSSCNNIYCGFDLGDCGYCAPGCNQTMLLNSVCDSACNVSYCMYDNNACGWCAPGCYQANLLDTVCHSNCNNSACNYQNGACSSWFCSSGCSPVLQYGSTCDLRCNNSACGWANGTCLCSPGCTYAMEYSTSQLYSACNNTACNFQNYVYGSCAYNCFTANIGNGVCDPQCNNAACSYDGGDCSCAAGCNSKYDNNTSTWQWDKNVCNPSCLVESCLFNYAVCNDATSNFLIRSAWIKQLTDGNIYEVPSWDSCSSSSPTKGQTCDLTTLQTVDSTGNCNPNCNTQECAYCLGLSVTSASCQRSTGSSSTSSCSICKNNNVQIYNYCLGQNSICPPGFSLIPALATTFLNSNVCLREPTKYSVNYYYLIYVDINAASGGNGTANNPYNSLATAFSKATREYTKIYIKPGNYTYSKTNVTNPLVTDNTNPFKTAVDLNIKEIRVEGTSSTNRPVINVNNDIMKFYVSSQSFYIKNVVFNGVQALSNNCAGGSCSYCPYYTNMSIYYFDDRGNPITNLGNLGTTCSDFNSYDFITVPSSRSLYLDTVDVFNFQQQFNSFINSQGSVTLTNVNFNMIQSANAWIIMSCTTSSTGTTNNCNSAFTFNGGSVKNLNYGYEYRTSILQYGFLTASNLGSFYMSNVAFNYDMAVTGSSSTVYYDFITLTNTQETVTITSCTFQNMFLNTFLRIDTSALSYTEYTVDKFNNFLEFSETHLTIYNSTFQNIATLRNFLVYTMENIVQNIYISNCVFSSIAANLQGLIYIKNNGEFTSTETSGTSAKYYVGGVYTSGTVAARSIYISNLVFSNISYSEYLIYISKQPNVYISNISLSNTMDISYSDINTYVISNFMKNTYITLNIPSGVITTHNCTAMIDIENGYNITTVNVTSKNNICYSGYSGMNLVSNTYLTLSNTYASTLISLLANELFLMSSNTYVSIYNMSIYNVHLAAPAILRVSGSQSVLLNYFTGSSLVSDFESPVVLNTNVNNTIYNFTCYQCRSSYGNGGGLNILPSTVASLVYISSFNCTQCSAPAGSGGGIYLQSYSIYIQHNVYLYSLFMNGCKASDGAGIFITNTVSVDASVINSTIIENSSSTQGGIITDNHNKGKILISYYTSINNTAFYSGIKGFYASSQNVMEIDNTYVLNPSSSQSVFYFYSLNSNTSIGMQVLTIKNSTSPAINLFSINLTLSQVTTDSGSGIQLSSSSQVTGTNINFYNNTGPSFAASASAFTCTNCKFINLTNGPAFSLETSSNFSVSSSVFKNISSTSSGIGIYLNGCNNTVNTIINCVFSFCSSSTSAALITMQSSWLSISNSQIFNNTSSGMNAGISLISSILLVDSTTFANQSSTMGSFIYFSTNSQGTISNSYFLQGTAANSGGAINLIMSTISLNNCVFTGNTAGTGGAVNGITLSNYTITSCTFTNNTASTGSAINFSGTSLSISKSIISGSLSSSELNSHIYLESPTTMTMDSTNISGVNVLGIYSQYTDSLTLINSYFNNLQGSLYAILSKATDTSYYLIQGCGFINNYNSSDGTGGAIYLKEVSVNISDSEFLNNSAAKGAGIYYTCPSNLCRVNIANTSFINNSASTEGGAIYWLDYRPLLANITYSGNKAPYGGDQISVAASLSVSNSRRLSTITCVPGEACKELITIALKDALGNTMTTDNSSVATMQVTNSSSVCSVSGTSSQTAVNGEFNFVDYVISGTPGITCAVNITTSAIVPADAEKYGYSSTFQSILTYYINLRNCTTGEQIGLTTCALCGSGKYTIDPSDSCISCPTGGNCTGGWTIYPIAGYWKPLANSTNVYACPLAAACLGSLNSTDYTGTCADGYTGNECLGCQTGYSRSGTKKCGKCPSVAVNVAIIIGLGIGVVVVCFILVRSTIKSAYTPTALHSIYIKIFTNYLQLVMLTTEFDLEWPSYVTSLFDAQTTVATASDQIYSLDCYFTNEGESYETIYYLKLLVTALLPILIWIAGLVVWIIICLLKDTWKYIQRELVTTMIVLFFLVYPNIVKTMFAVFSCTEIVGKGWWVSDNLTVKCWTESHIKYSLLIAFSSIICWAIGVPTLVLVMIYKRRKNLNTDANRVRFGFLYNGYKQSRFFWEFVIMYRKILIISISVFMINLGSSIQALTLILLLIFCLYGQYEFKPYNRNQLNHMEMEAIFTASITIYCGMYYLTNDIGEGFKSVLFLFICLGNGYFLFYWLYYMSKAIIDFLSSTVPVLRQLKGKRDPYPEYINSVKYIRSGIIKNDEEGILKYTILKKDVPDQEKIELPNINSMKDLYYDTMHQIIQREQEDDDRESFRMESGDIEVEDNEN